MKQQTETIIEKWEPDSDAYKLLASFLVKRFVVKANRDERTEVSK